VTPETNVVYDPKLGEPPIFSSEVGLKAPVGFDLSL
jgi:hypothetical protein